MSEICPKCGMSHVPYGSLEQPSPYCPVDSITVPLTVQPTPEPRESGPYKLKQVGPGKYSGIEGPGWPAAIVGLDAMLNLAYAQGRIAGAKETVERMRKWAEKNSFAFSDYQVGQIRLFLDTL